MTREAFSRVYELAADQFGYLTASQAREAGVAPMALVMMEKRQTVERVSRGVYRLQQFPMDPLAEYMEAALWPAGTVGVISHDSALALHGISDVNPGRIHLTLPRRYRVRRALPGRLAIHYADLDEDEQILHEGIPVTTVARTAQDCRAAAVGRETIEQAETDAVRLGLLGAAEATALRSDLYPSAA
jgi:predicted transcriptional regulator of viral defense system